MCSCAWSHPSISKAPVLGGLKDALGGQFAFQADGLVALARAGGALVATDEGGVRTLRGENNTATIRPEVDPSGREVLVRLGVAIEGGAIKGEGGVVGGCGGIAAPLTFRSDRSHEHGMREQVERER